MRSHVWVIEMLVNNRWEPTTGCGMSRSDALMFMRAEWKPSNPHYEFRVMKYVREKEGKGGTKKGRHYTNY